MARHKDDLCRKYSVKLVPDIYCETLQHFAILIISMKGLFPQYAVSSELNYKEIWKQALIVFDTNVLLNLYRYRSNTRDELLSVIKQLSGQIWIPHHVALEFQRGRLKVIVEQNKKFSEVRKTIDEAQKTLSRNLEKLELLKRHSSINPDSLITGFVKLIDEFLAELQKLEEKQQKPLAHDSLKDELEALFEDRVGIAPKNQAEIDVLYKLADNRFKNRIPPGYQDAEKGKADTDGYTHGGIIYKRMFGDFLIWNQLLTYVKDEGHKSLIFITDDGKEDWWLKLDSNGPKTIGPRPELIEEARRSASVDTFLMYDPEGFLKYSKEFLETEVSEETLEEVREVTTERSWVGLATRLLNNSGYQENSDILLHGEEAVKRWLINRNFSEIRNNSSDFPDYTCRYSGNKFGIAVKAGHDMDKVFLTLPNIMSLAEQEIKEGNFSEIIIIWVVNSAALIAKLSVVITRAFHENKPSGINMVIGVLESSESGEIKFVDKRIC